MNPLVDHGPASRPCLTAYGGCGAAPNEPCVSKDGAEHGPRPLTYHHAARRHPRHRVPGGPA